MTRSLFQRVRQITLALIAAAVLSAPVTADAQPQQTMNPSPTLAPPANLRAMILGRWFSPTEKDWYVFTNDGQVTYSLLNNRGERIPPYGGSWSIENDVLRMNIAQTGESLTRVTFPSRTEMIMTYGGKDYRYVRDE